MAMSENEHFKDQLKNKSDEILKLKEAKNSLKKRLAESEANESTQGYSLQALEAIG